MKFTVRNLTASPLSTDVGLLQPYETRSITLSPDQMYKAGEGFKSLVDAGRVSIVTEFETSLADNSETVPLDKIATAAGYATLQDQYTLTTKYLYIYNGEVVISDDPP